MNENQENSRFRNKLKRTYLNQVRHWINHLVTLAKWLFTPLALTFLAAALWQSQSIIYDTIEHSLPIFFILAVLVWMVTHFLSPVFSYIVLNTCGEKLGYRQILDIHLHYLPARHIPGGIWHTVARVSRLHSLGSNSRHLSCLVILENLVSPGVALTVGGMVVGIHQFGRVWQVFAFLAAAISLLVLILCPILMNRLIFRAVGTIRFPAYVALLATAIAFWSFATTSFLLFLSALPNGFDSSAWLELAGAYLFSWGIGFIAIFAPQGVGVFEVVAATTMPTSLPFNAFVALLAGYRLVVILADVMLWVGWVTLRYMKTFRIKNITHS